ncbi:hypothetical protein Tco_0656276 [Tanacetum coccineum]|uniref:Uncharacterized protein n=1 Tax=Tanacetum coccineum TaxID=301880 RepID=A0ABQ4X8Q1_9ASTR
MFLHLYLSRATCLANRRIVNEISSNSDNNTSDSASTSQINTSEEIDYDSPEYKGPPKSLLKWYDYLSDEYKDKGRFWSSKSGGNKSDAKPSFSDISKAKSCMLAKAQASDASSKAKVQAFGSKTKLQTSSSVSSGPSNASVPIFKGSSVQRLLDQYGYNDIEKFLSWNYFPSTDKENTYKDITDKDITNEDCIHESNYAIFKGKYVLVSHKHNPKVKIPVPVTEYVLGLANVTTWDEIMNKMGVRKYEIYADKAKGKRKVSYGS